MRAALDKRLELTYAEEERRRWIAGRETIIHCHHYNASIQRTLESATAIDGRGIFVSTIEGVFGQLLSENFYADEDTAQKWQFASNLYSHLGFGTLDTSRLEDGVVTAPSSHYVEGWTAGFSSELNRVCSMTEGYLQGAYSAITGEAVYVREVECQAHGAAQCKFEIDRERSEPIFSYDKKLIREAGTSIETATIESPTVDETTIVKALMEMPIEGGQDGLIPAFNVYLSSMPADFYNLVTIRFLEAMEQKQLGDVARMQMVHAGETCGLNTFRGIRESAEWDALIAPMVHTKEDEVFGLVAVINGLGWGNWHVTEMEPAKSLALRTCNGYEATGYQELRGTSKDTQCLMLVGGIAGVFELVYGEGSIEERFGQCEPAESTCRCQSGNFCEFTVQSL